MKRRACNPRVNPNQRVDVEALAAFPPLDSNIGALPHGPYRDGRKPPKKKARK